MVWRGTVALRGQLHDRIDHLLVVEEPMTDAPLTAADYAAILEEKLIDKRALAAKEEEAARAKEAAAIKAQGLKDAIGTLKEGGAPPDLISAVEKQDTLEGAQETLARWVDEAAKRLHLPPPAD